MATDLRQQLGQVLVKVQQGVVTFEDLWRKLISFRSKEELQACINYGLTVGLFRQNNKGELSWTKKTVAEVLAGVTTLDLTKVNPVVSSRKEPERREKTKPLSAPKVDHTAPALPSSLIEGKPLPYFLYAFLAKIACSLVEEGGKFHVNHIIAKVNSLGYGEPLLETKVTDTLKLIARMGFPKGGAKIIAKEAYGKAWYISLVPKVDDATLIRDLQGARMQKEAQPVSKARKVLDWAAKWPLVAFSAFDLYAHRVEIGYTEEDSLETVRGTLNYVLYSTLKKPNARGSIMTVSRGRYVLASRLQEVPASTSKVSPQISRTRRSELRKNRSAITKLTRRRKEVQVRLDWKETQCAELRKEIDKIDREIVSLNAAKSLQ